MIINSSIKWKPLLISILIPIMVGGLAGFLTRGSMGNYQIIERPPLSPPGIVFPFIWGILYILMGIASYLVYQKDSNLPQKTRALKLYSIQLVLNFFWPILFFNLQNYELSFILLLILLIFVLITTIDFYSISRNAGLLLIPYLIWLLFAAYLNLGVVILSLV